MGSLVSTIVLLQYLVDRTAVVASDGIYYSIQESGAYACMVATHVGK